MPRPPVNDRILDSVLQRSLRLERLKAGEIRTVFRALRRLEVELLEALEGVDPGANVPYWAKSSRQAKVLKEAQDLIRVTYSGINNDFARTLRELASVESQWLLTTATEAVGVDVMGTRLSGAQVRAIASDTLIEGAPSKEWWSRQAANTRRDFEAKVRTGVLRGDTTQEITRSVRGTKAAGYTDGIGLHARGGKATRQAEALVRTSVQTVSNEARKQTIEENEDVVKSIQWVSTLDNRTTLTCMGLHGKTWSLPDYDPEGHKFKWPGPTAHWNCRSTQVPVMKSWEELSDGRVVSTDAGGKAGMQNAFEKELRAMGLPESRIKAAVSEARASMDGQVPADVSFGGWLKGKSNKVQEQLLGKKRAQLFREGKASLDQMVSQDGRPLKLSEL